MTSIEAYLIANVFVGVSGYGCGAAEKTLELRNELPPTNSFIILLAGIASLVLSIVYGFRWADTVPAGYFVWVPALIIWFVARRWGMSWIEGNQKNLTPWRASILACLLSVVTYEIAIDYIRLAAHLSIR